MINLLPLIMTVESLIAAVICLCLGSYVKAIYWVGSALLLGSTMFMK